MSRRSLTLPPHSPQPPGTNRRRIGSMLLPLTSEAELPAYPSTSTYLRADESEPCLPPCCPPINSQLPLTINSPCTCSCVVISRDDQSPLGRHSPLISSAASSSRHNSQSQERPPRPVPPIADFRFPKLSTASRFADRNLDEFIGAHQKSRQVSCFGKCALCVLLNIVFVFTLFVALFIGHFSTDSSLSSNTGRRSRSPSIKEIYPPTLDGTTTDDYVFDEFGSWPYYENGGQTPPTDGSLEPLPSNVIPRHYDISLDFTRLYDSIPSPQILGNVSIHLESFGNSTTNEILFHAAASIFIIRISLRDIEGHKIDVNSVQRNTDKSLVRIYIGERLESTFYLLNVEFHTRICTPDSAGVHCFYAHEEGREVLAGFSTKFEPCFARQFVPGWDEPRVKSTFNVSIRHFTDVAVLTNTAPLRRASGIQADIAGRGITVEKGQRGITNMRYEQSLPMPLYLLAFATAPFTPIELRTSNKLPVRIWCDPSEALGLQFATNFSPIMLDRIQNDFGIKYPLSKMDIFVTPNFPVGGMENWGLIVFHISTLTMSPQVRQTSPYEPSSSSQAYNMENSDSDSDGLSRADRRGKHRMLAIDRMAEQYRVEKAIIHELVHQWFGNLVTMNDWSQLWLSEGFATYFVFDFLNTDHPHLTEHEYFMRLIELLQKQTSSQASALLVSPGRVDELHRMFDGLHLYTKGAVLVKMLKDLVGSQAFRAGVTRYLKQNAYKSVDTGALWSSLPSTVDHGIESVKLAEVVSPWLYNKGVPEVIVQRGYDTHSIQIVQQKSDQNQHIVYLKDDYDFGEADKASDSSEIKREKREFRTHENALIRKKMRSAEARSDVPLSESNERSDYKALKGREAPRSSKRVHQNKKNNHRHKSERRKKDDLPKNEKGMRKKFSVFSDHGKNQKLKKEDEERGLHSSLEGIDVLIMGNNEATHRNRYRESRAKNSQTVREEAEKSIWPILFSYSFGSVKNPNGRTLRQLWFRNKTAKFVDTGIHRGMYLLANPHWVYPYKVNYDLENWQLLIEQLRKSPTEIPVMSRMQLIVDAETYLMQSAVPHLYVQLLSYLSRESDLGVLLVGLDAIHKLTEMFSGSNIFGPLLVHLMPAIERIDRYLLAIERLQELGGGDDEVDPVDPEEASLWLLNPHRLTKLYQLRCLANLESCHQTRQVQNWMQFPTALAADNHQQVVAICHHLFARAGPKEVELLSGLLLESEAPREGNSSSQEGQFTSGGIKLSATIQQLVTGCVQDEVLVERVVQQILRTRNAVVYSAALNYNRKFREFFWKGMSQKLGLHERQILFAVNTGKSDWMARVLLHSVGSLGELNLVEKIVLPSWPELLHTHIKYLRRKFHWIESKAAKRIREYLVKAD